MRDLPELGGVLAMMPGFATADATSLHAMDTIDLVSHAHAVDKIVRDGVDVIATTGSFGEGYALETNEFRTLVGATVEVVAGRIPVFAGCVGSSAREILARARMADELGCDGVLLSLPNYFPLTQENAVGFLKSVAEAIPERAVLLYHNPLLHRTALTIAAVAELAKLPNVVGLKDSHRDGRAMIELMEVTERSLSVFVAAGQYVPLSPLGAAGLWSYDCWMDPWPVVALRDAVAQSDLERATRLTRMMVNPYEGPTPPDVRWRETAAKLAVAAAGYCDPGPLRAPFVDVPIDVRERAESRAAAWTAIRASVEGA